MAAHQVWFVSESVGHSYFSLLLVLPRSELNSLREHHICNGDNFTTIQRLSYEMDRKGDFLRIKIQFRTLSLLISTYSLLLPTKGQKVKLKVKSFYSVNYVNIYYSVKYSTVDCKCLLSLQDFFLVIKTKTV